MTNSLVRTQLAKMLASETFGRSGRLSALLRFVVEEGIKGQGDRLKEQVIAAELYGKTLGFDPANDPAVRVDARRLRDRLRAYYESEGAADAIRIQVPKGGYAAQFLPLSPEIATPSPLVKKPAPGSRCFPWRASPTIPSRNTWRTD